jgi:hypothetical protein
MKVYDHLFYNSLIFWLIFLDKELKPDKKL